MNLTEALEELERTNPQVRAAAARYDFAVWRINRKAERMIAAIKREATATPSPDPQEKQ